MNESCPVCGGVLNTPAPACPHCGFKLIESTQKFAPVTLEDDLFIADALPSAKATLCVVRGPQTGVSIQLGDSSMTIGRSPQCDVFLNDMTVSREHATIVPSGSCYVIQDANSFNGVWVNNVNIDSSYKLLNGDIIQIGAFCLVYKEE